MCLVLGAPQEPLIRTRAATELQQSCNRVLGAPQEPLIALVACFTCVAYYICGAKKCVVVLAAAQQPRQLGPIH